MFGYGELTATEPAVLTNTEQEAADQAANQVGKRVLDTKAPAAMKLWEGEAEAGWELRGFIVGAPDPDNPSRAIVQHRDRID